ncbi:MAG: response regulator transcription factor [Hahellaceae bacterium]|jgi:two-component system response regulator RegX3|nr:response regulator transcription factor [Hahellaceae bacterium]MCP5212767.1 response regulator transcription factor [Hahellaceae bacterium]
MEKKLKLLIVEDEIAIRTGLVDVFVYHGYDVDFSGDGLDGLQKARTGRYDMVLLDVMLPGMDGFEICRHIRQQDKEQPIIMLTAKNTDDAIIQGLSLGADDYVAKPFSVAQLVLRVEAVLRRSRSVQEDLSQLTFADVVIDTRTLNGHKGSQAQVFTRREVDILTYLLRNQERPITREELLHKVWGYGKNLEIETRTVDIHIAKLRRKIESDSKNPSLLVTVRGEGYRLMSAE